MSDSTGSFLLSFFCFALYTNSFHFPHSCRAGWWFGEAGGDIIWISLLSDIGIVFSLLIFPHVAIWVGLRGPKAPHWLTEVLSATDGHIPRLKGASKYHFFLSKHEAQKRIALPMAKALTECGFKVWVSQYEARRGEATDKSAMQRGVRQSECVLLVMTKGIFHRDRFWVTNTEVKYGVKECGKPLLCVLPDHYVDRFDLDVKYHK